MFLNTTMLPAQHSKKDVTSYEVWYLYFFDCVVLSFFSMFPPLFNFYTVVY